MVFQRQPQSREIGREERLARLADLVLRGRGPAAICTDLDITISQLREMQAELKTRWRQSASRDTDEIIQQELARLEHLQAEYWAAWESSQMTIEIPLSTRLRMQRNVSRRISFGGDPTYLAGVLACMDRRSKMLGLDAPLKVDVTARIRAMAEAAGFDPDEAIEEAARVIAEARAIRPR